MDEKSDPKAAERTDEQPEDLDVAADDADAVKGGDAVKDATPADLNRAQHEIKKSIVQNFRV
jgi:hypothetical protein